MRAHFCPSICPLAPLSVTPPCSLTWQSVPIAGLPKTPLLPNFFYFSPASNQGLPRGFFRVTAMYLAFTTGSAFVRVLSSCSPLPQLFPDPPPKGVLPTPYLFHRCSFFFFICLAPVSWAYPPQGAFPFRHPSWLIPLFRTFVIDSGTPYLIVRP